MNELTVVIGLRPDERGDTPVGRITRPGGEVIHFSGWIGLIASLDALLRDGCGARLDVYDTTSQGGTS